MAVNLAAIGSLSGYEDPNAGVRERFLTPEIGGGRTIAVVSEPLSDPHPIAWVICHSFGLEQDNLQSFEVGMARRLAGSGFATLRYHSQGYGDSELPVEHATLETHVQGAVDAAWLLMSTRGVSSVGLIGARFGGSVALLAAERVNASAAVLLHPVVRGRPYMQALIRSGLVAGLSGDGRTAPPSEHEDPIEAMRRVGYADLLGFPLRPEVFDGICELDLTRAPGSFEGRSLVMQISRSATPRREVGQLVDRLRALGGECRLEVLADENALRFGLPGFRAVSATTKVDLLAGLSEAITATVVAWCAGGQADRHPDRAERP